MAENLEEEFRWSRLEILYRFASWMAKDKQRRGVNSFVARRFVRVTTRPRPISANGVDFRPRPRPATAGPSVFFSSGGDRCCDDTLLICQESGSHFLLLLLIGVRRRDHLRQ